MGPIAHLVEHRVCIAGVAGSSPARSTLHVTFCHKTSMKNILLEKPTDELHGRFLAAVSFVAEEDVRDKEVLDIGCGFGWSVYHFLMKGAKCVHGMEQSSADLETARSHITDRRVNFVVGSALELPFANASIDTVVAWEVLEHIPPNTEQRMFQEVWRVLKEGGRFYLSTPHDSFFVTLLDPAWWLIGHRHYRRSDLEHFATQNGFQVIRMEIGGRFWNLLGLLNMYISKWILRRHLIGETFFNAHMDREYEQWGGYMNIFAAFQKI